MTVGVDVGLARLSNELIAGGIAAYSLGFLGYAIDAAFGNHAPLLPDEKAARLDVRVPALVGGAPGAPLAGSAPGATGPETTTTPPPPPPPASRSFVSAHAGQFAIAV